MLRLMGLIISKFFIALENIKAKIELIQIVYADFWLTKSFQS